MCVCDRIECQLNMVVSKRKWYISITLFHSFCLCVFRVGVRADFMWFDIVVAGYASVISYGWKLNWPLWKKICSNNNKDHGQIMMTTAKWMVRMAIKLESSIRWSINCGLSFVIALIFVIGQIFKELCTPTFWIFYWNQIENLPWKLYFDQIILIFYLLLHWKVTQPNHRLISIRWHSPPLTCYRHGKKP